MIKHGIQKVSDHFGRKSDAANRGKHLAKKAPLGQIKIHKQDGTIQTAGYPAEATHKPGIGYVLSEIPVKPYEQKPGQVDSGKNK